MKPTIRATTLDMFRRVKEGSIEEEELISYLQGKSEVTENMVIGTSWHAAMNGGDPSMFFAEDVDRGITMTEPCLREVRLTMDCGPAILTGQLDAVCPPWVFDYKTTMSGVNENGYDTSLQWRSYLLLACCDVFEYIVVHLEEDGTKYRAKEFATIRHWYYVGIESDVVFWVEEFVRWSRRRNMTHLLKPV